MRRMLGRLGSAVSAAVAAVAQVRTARQARRQRPGEGVIDRFLPVGRRRAGPGSRRSAFDYPTHRASAQALGSLSRFGLVASREDQPMGPRSLMTTALALLVVPPGHPVRVGRGWP